MIQPRQVLLFCALLLLFTITILEVCMHSHYSISQFVSVSATDTDTDTQVELRTLERGAAMPPPRVPSRSLLAPQHTALNGERTRAPSATSTTRPQWRIPRLFHQFARDVHLPAPYMMSLSGLLRHHRIRDPNAPAFAAAARNESFTRGAEERSDARSAHSVFNVSRSNCTHNSSLCASVFGFTPEPEPESRRSAAPLAGSSFDYYLWSDAAIKDFIANVRSDTNRAALQKYGHVLEQSDAVRYAILYEFGGVYLDMDVEFVAPIANYLERGYPCVFPEENPLQTAPNWKRTYIVTQSVIICRPHHPFLRLLLETLPEFNKRGITISRTGPHFVTEVLERYRRSNTTLEAICSVDARSHPDCVHVEAPHVFDSLDFFNSPSYVSYCRRRLDEVEKKSPKKVILMIRYSILEVEYN